MSDAVTDMEVLTSARAKDFQSVYIALRDLEKRLYTDDEVLQLPHVSAGHIYKKEWDVRADSCRKLVQHLSAKNEPLNILEVGCGNGWLSYQLSKIEGAKVLGADINLVELTQAKKVFAHQPNLKFTNIQIQSPDFNDVKFDVIVFAASIQYFRSFKEIINIAIGLLNAKGEIHIIDSHFYEDIEISEAQKRSSTYFKKMGFENMKEFYFHHSLNDVKKFDYHILYDPNSVFNKMLRRQNLFYWVCIRKI